MSSTYTGNPAEYPPDIPLDDDGDTPYAARVLNRAALEGLADRTAHSAAAIAVHETRLDNASTAINDYEGRLVTLEHRSVYQREWTLDVPDVGNPAPEATLDATAVSIFFVGRNIPLTANRQYTLSTSGLVLGTRRTVVSYEPDFQVHIVPGLSPHVLGVFLRRGEPYNYDWVDLVLDDLSGTPTWFVVRGGYNPP